MIQTAVDQLIRDALRFAVWAAGEGLSPAEGEPAEAPENFLFRYSQAAEDYDWDTLPDRILTALCSNSTKPGGRGKSDE